MLYILDRNEKVVGLLQSNSDRNKNIYYDDILTEILSSGADTLSFTTISDRNTSKNLIVGNYIAFKKGNKFKLMQIMEVNENKEDILTKEIYCEGAGLELINTVYSGSKMSSVNIERFLKNILQDTDWKVGYIDSNLTKTLSLDVEEKEVYSIIQEYLYDFEAEIDFRVEIKGNIITGRYIDAYSKRGKNNGRRLEINRDIKSISRKVSLTEYATKLIGEGKNGLNFRDISMSGEINKPLGQNFVINEEAYSRINNKGKHITRKFIYDTEDAYELLRQTHKALKEYSEPKVTYEVDANILNFDDIEIGDYISISDLSFTPPLLVTARISELETSKTNKYSNKAVLSNFNEVRSGISSIFPILGDNIVSGSIGGEQMNPDYVDSIVSDSVNATMVKTEVLLANKANIGDLNATNAEIENLKVNKAEITDLNATNANIDNLKANFAEIDELLAGNITADNIKANSITSNHIQANAIETKHLKANSIDANHIQANTITSGHIQADTINSNHIQTGTITAGNGIIADGAIGNAQISKIDAGKIEAGTIDTSKVTIQGANGHLRLKGNRMQVFDGVGNQAKERVSVGDVNGDGTVYGLRVRGADGQTVLLDENGVTSEGITNGSITNNKISDNAEIDGAKLNINSVITKINEDGSETINGTKIEVDGTTLNTKLSTITNKQTEDSEKISQAQSQITANTNAIKLKVDEQTYAANKKDMTSKLEKNTSEISAMKGQIALKVEQTDIDRTIEEIEIGAVNYALGTINAKTFTLNGADNQNIPCYPVLDNTSNQDVVVSFDYEFKDLIILDRGEIYFQAISTKEDGAIQYVPKVECFKNLLVDGNSNGNISFKTKFPTFKSGTILNFRFRSNCLQGTFIISNVQVELGNKKTNWKANPADIEIKVEEKISSAKAEINVETDKISQSVSKLETTTTELAGKVTNQESRLSSAEQKITDKAITSVVQESQFIKDMDGKISTNKSNISKIEQTANSITSRVDGLDGKYTQLKQTVDGIDVTGKVSFSDLSTAGKTTINGANIDTTNLRVRGELISGQINGVGGIRFADGAVISSYDSHVVGYKGISISAPSIKLGDRVDIYSPTLIGTVTGKSSGSSSSSSWIMSNSGRLNCSTINTSSTTTVGGTLNVRNNMINGMNNLQMGRGSVYIPIFGSSGNFDYIKGGGGMIAIADTGPIHFLYNGTKSSFIAGGTVYLPHAGNVNCDHLRLGAGIMASPSSGSFHFLTANGNTSPLYAGTLYSADVLALNKPMVMSTNSVFDKINSIDVIETKNGLRLYNSISTMKAIDKSTEVVKTEYDEDKNELKTSIDYTSAIATLWKAVQELKQENNELKEIIKSLCPKE